MLSLSGHKQLGPSGHSPGPLGVCNPNEKQKPPPLHAASIFRWCESRFQSEKALIIKLEVQEGHSRA